MAKLIVLFGVILLIGLGCSLIFNMSYSGINGSSLFVGLVTLAVIGILGYFGVQYIVSRG